MKKLSLTLLTFLACGAAYALPVGNPSDASLLCDGWVFEGRCPDPCDPYQNWYNALSFRAGFYGDYVFDRKLETTKTTIEKTKINTNAAFLAANIWDRLDIFTTLGATNLKIDTNAFSFTGLETGARLALNTETSFSWSLGARGTIWECGCTHVGIEGQYFTTSPNLDRITLASTTSANPTGVEAHYHEWQMGLGIAHRIHLFVPYVALKWSHAELDFDNAAVTVGTELAQLANIKNRDHWGFAIGVSMIDCEKVSLTAEGRFGDETALHINGQIRF